MIKLFPRNQKSGGILNAVVGIICGALIMTSSAFGQSSVTPDTLSPPVGEREPSTCLAIAGAPAGIQVASIDWPPITQIADNRYSVEIAFAGHSTFRIKTAEGLVVATDFNGFAGVGVVPDVITMNRAHSSHYTHFVDPQIEYVFRGWGQDGETPADHHTVIKDLLIRNVTTDVRSWETGGLRLNDNSIFIFEAAGLCIGHLGHLHHELTDAHYAAIGRLDVLMVPVDGSYTLNQASMAKIVQRLRTSIILPMHYFSSGTLRSFLNELGTFADIVVSEETTATVSLNTLPSKPTVLVLQPS